ncbi:MAG: hypothetical protein CMJ75_18895 [Planctomycetaceae bacterium]|nr:hypothetical protein [Planctomycetaceae bacterium]
MVDDRIFAHCFFGMGSNRRTDTNPWGFGWNLNHSWERFLDGPLAEAYGFGFRKFILHRPYGESDVGDAMDFDSAVDIREATGENAPDAVNADSVRAFLDAFKKRFPDASITVYYGSLKDDSFEDLEPADFLRRMAESLEPWLEYDFVDFALDNGSSPNNYPVGGKYWAASEVLRKLIEDRGGRYWIEAIPGADQPEKDDVPAMALERFWRRLLIRDPLAVNRSGPVLRIWNGHVIDDNDFDNDPIKWIADCWKNGHEFAVSWGTFRHLWPHLNKVYREAYEEAIGIRSIDLGRSAAVSKRQEEMQSVEVNGASVAME